MEKTWMEYRDVSWYGVISWRLYHYMWNYGGSPKGKPHNF